MAGSSARRWAPVLLFALPGHRDEPRADETHVRPVSIVRPDTYWASHGFVEMTPPIRLPSRDGAERIIVWLRVPDGQRIAVVRRADGAATLSYPTETVSDRVDIRDWREPSSVQDVRGTRFEQGQEYFHVLRPLSPAGLEGLEWPRGDQLATRAATEEMLARLGEQAPSLFAMQNDCASCHAHDKAERRRFPSNASVATAEGAAPNRGTDADGLYTVATVLADSAPLETHRPRDMNEGDPYVSVACEDGTAAELVVGARGRWRHFRCDDGSVPYARFDLGRALAEEDAHARAVCQSRAYLWNHMDGDGRAAFASAFEECGLSAARLPP
jgi:hypothetical protein